MPSLPVTEAFMQQVGWIIPATQMLLSRENGTTTERMYSSYIDRPPVHSHFVTFLFASASIIKKSIDIPIDIAYLHQDVMKSTCNKQIERRSKHDNLQIQINLPSGVTPKEFTDLIFGCISGVTLDPSVVANKNVLKYLIDCGFKKEVEKTCRHVFRNTMIDVMAAESLDDYSIRMSNLGRIHAFMMTLYSSERFTFELTPDRTFILHDSDKRSLGDSKLLLKKLPLEFAFRSQSLRKYTQIFVEIPNIEGSITGGYCLQIDLPELEEDDDNYIVLITVGYQTFWDLEADIGTANTLLRSIFVNLAPDDEREPVVNYQGNTIHDYIMYYFSQRELPDYGRATPAA
jgi:hypothetical protein